MFERVCAFVRPCLRACVRLNVCVCVSVCVRVRVCPYTRMVIPLGLHGRIKQESKGDTTWKGRRENSQHASFSIHIERLVQAKQKGGNRQLMASGTAHHFAREITATEPCHLKFQQPRRQDM